MVPERAAEADQILSFWFEDCRPWQWFRRSSAFDREVRCRFGELTQTAQRGGLIDWESDQPSALALVLLLDQFSRQIWRDQPQAYLGDARARRLSKQAIHQGWLLWQQLLEQLENFVRIGHSFNLDSLTLMFSNCHKQYLEAVNFF